MQHSSVAAVSVAPSAAALPSLRSRAIFGSMWMIVGYGAAQGFRLVSSIVLSRLIMPEITGLMAMVSVFLMGLEMFSDIGIAPSIIQNQRGDQPSFLNTAWTIQVVRGFGLWIASCVGAWPVSQFFNEPALLWLIPIAGFTAVISGFNSTSIVWLNRRLALRRITILGIASELLLYAVMITWALLSPTVWALVGASIVSTLFYTIATHFLVAGHHNWFHWNRDDARSLFRFGQWIFFSTVLTFFAGQADRIMCGKLLGAFSLGVYNYAAAIAIVGPQLIKQLGKHIAFPVLSEVARERPETMFVQLRRVRLVLVGTSLVLLLPLMIFGKQLIQLLYPEVWWDAGWMLQILAGGALAGFVNSTYGAALLAMGKSFQIACLLAVQIVLLLAASLLGYYLKGEVGFIIGLAAVEWLNYPANAILMARYKLWQPSIDLPALAFSAGAIVAAMMLFSH